MKTPEPKEVARLEQTAFVLKTIAHPLRLRIVALLGENERLSVNEICIELECEQSLVSHHLSLLKLKGVLQSQRNGKQIFYFLAMREVLKVIACMENCYNRP